MKKTFCFITFLLILVNCHYADSQSLSVFKVDASAFPIIKAKVYAFDAAGNQITNLSPSDFEVKENGIQRTVTDVSCPNPPPPNSISAVLTIDISGSMGGNGILLASEFAKAWVNLLPQDNSECALTSFGSLNYINQDFTSDQNKLINAISNLQIQGGTDYDYGLLKPVAGSLEITKPAKNQKIIIFITDGFPNQDPQINQIITEANKQDCLIYTIIVGYDCPQILKDISEQTGGEWFDNINTVDDAKKLANQILKTAQHSNPCTLKWLSGVNCEEGIAKVQVHLNLINQNSNIGYQFPDNFVSKLEINPMYVKFIGVNPGTQKDTIIKVTAINSDFNVTNITSSNPSFSINPTSFLLPDGKSKDLKVSFLPVDSGFTYTKFTFESNICSSVFYSSGGFHAKPAKVKSLKLTYPNGGEEFVIGSDTLITWEGIPENENVKLEYTIDNGITWKEITNVANNLKDLWKNIPAPASTDCLVKASQRDADITPKIEWQTSIGGSSHDTPIKIIQTIDGGYIVIGNTSSNDGDVIENKGGVDAWIVKLNSTGLIEWQKTIGGSMWDACTSIEQTLDGGYILGGYTDSNDFDSTGLKGSRDAWIIKFTLLGSIEWQKLLGGKSLEDISCVQQTFDGGYITAGSSQSTDGDYSGNKGYIDVWIAKLNSKGSIVWQKTMGGSSRDEAYSVQQTIDGGYIIVGGTESRNGDIAENKGSNDAWIVKLNSIGKIEWQKTIGGTKYDVATSVLQSIDGGYIFVGYTESSDGNIAVNKGDYDLWVVQINSIGVIEWQKIFGGSKIDYATNIKKTVDGGYIIGGTTNSADGDLIDNKYGSAFWVLKLNSLGILEWQKVMGGSETDRGAYVQQTLDNGYIITGSSNSTDGDLTENKGQLDIWLAKLSSEGEIIQYDESDSVFSIVAPMAQANDIDMKKCLVGSSKDSVITDFVRNIGSYKFSVNSIYFTGPDSLAFNLIAGRPKYILEPKESKTSEINFTPNRIGIHSAIINIVTQADTLRQNIQGEGVEPQLEVISNFLDFGKVEILHENTIQDTALIKNISNIPVTIIDVIQLGPDKTQFEVISGGGSFTLQPNESRKLTLRFKSIFGGRTSGQLGFEYNGTGSPAVVQLFGTGIGGLVYILNDSAYAGEKRNLKLVMANIKPEGLAEIAPNFEAKIRFQNTILVPQDRSNSVMINDSVYMKISGSIGSNIEIAQIPVIAGLGTVEETSIDIVDIILKDNLGIKVDYNFEKNSGTFKLLGICREGGTRLFNPTGKVEILQISPNPAIDNIEISFNLIEEGSTTLSVFNSNGVKMKEFNLAGETGLKTINLDARDFTNGLYFIQLQTPTVVTNQKFMILR